jgi:acyl carrier protein
VTDQATINTLKQYIATEILDGQDIGLDGSTPLLEWGVLNSMEIARIVSFISRSFSVDVPSERITLEHFKDLDSIATLIGRLRNP